MKTIKYEMLLKSKMAKKIDLALILNIDDTFHYADKELQFKFNDKEHSVTVKETHFENLKEGCVLRLEMDNPDIYKMKAIEDLVTKIKIELSKAKISSTTLYDSISPFFYKDLATYLHDYEWKLRKMLYLLINEESDINELLPNDDLNDIKKREKGAFGKVKNDLLQQLTLIQLENFIFAKHYIDTEIEEELTTIKYQEMSHENLVEILLDKDKTNSEPYSLWDKHLVKYLPEDAKTVQDDMERIRISRNTISHNKEMGYKNYKELKKKLIDYIAKFKGLIKIIFEGSIKENDVNIIVEDFDLFSRSTMQVMGIVSNRLGSIPSENVINSMDLAGQNLTSELLSELANPFSTAVSRLNNDLLSELAKSANTAVSRLNNNLLSELAKPAGLAAPRLNSDILSELAKSTSTAVSSLNTDQLLPNSRILNLANQNMYPSSQFTAIQEAATRQERLRSNFGEGIANTYNNIFQNPNYNFQYD